MSTLKYVGVACAVCDDRPAVIRAMCRRCYEAVWRHEPHQHSEPSVFDPDPIGPWRDRVPLGAWGAKAACKGLDPEMFFPGRGEHGPKICGDCPVRAECLEYALVNNEKYGVWGGASERQRRIMRAARSKTAAVEAAV